MTYLPSKLLAAGGSAALLACLALGACSKDSKPAPQDTTSATVTESSATTEASAEKAHTQISLKLEGVT